MNSPRKPLEGDQSSRKSFKLSRLFSAMAIVITASLAACGGGSSGGGSPTATISGQVVDKVLSNAKVSIFSSGLSGSPLGTATTDSNGNYTITFTPPSGSTPLFLTAVSSGNTLSSYIGSANTFSGTVSSSKNPNLNVTQVTTAGLAVVQNQGLSLSSLTPTTYGQQITNLNNAIIQLAAVVQGVVDNGCTISSGTTSGLNTSNLSTFLGSNLSASTNVITTLVGDLSSCSTTTTASTLNTFASQIPSNQTIAPQLTSTSATNSSTSSVSAGTYTGTVTPIMTFNNSCSGEGPTAGSSSSTATVTISSSGSIKFVVSNGPSMTGTLSGNNFTMSGTDQNGSPISASGAFVALSSGAVSGGSGFSVNGGWQENCSSGSGNFGGTYNIPDLLSSGASLSSTPSTSVSNGTYLVSGSATNNTSACGGTSTIGGTITIAGSSISFTSSSSSNSGSGSGTLAGNTFTMTVTPGGGGGTLAVTGTINSQSSTSISISGSFQESNNSYCNGSGTYSLST